MFMGETNQEDCFSLEDGSIDCSETSVTNHQCEAIPVAALSKAWVYGRSLTRIAGSNPTGGMYVCLL
jgi:hypothetical protein